MGFDAAKQAIFQAINEARKELRCSSIFPCKGPLTNKGSSNIQSVRDMAVGILCSLCNDFQLCPPPIAFHHLSMTKVWRRLRMCTVQRW